eukprot:1127716-Amphidinium_carterae.2
MVTVQNVINTITQGDILSPRPRSNGFMSHSVAVLWHCARSHSVSLSHTSTLSWARVSLGLGAWNLLDLLATESL